MKPPRKVEVASQSETQLRSREVQILLNIIEPDPAYQPFLVTDEASPVDVTGADRELIRSRLEFYFRRSVPIPLTQPLWQLVDALKKTFPGWPDGWSSDNQ
jgi:hypothetical protein